MECPRCGLLNPDFALRCDCGYDFESKTVQKPYFRQELPGKIMGLFRASQLQMATFAYGLFYLTLVVLACIPNTRGLIINGDRKPPDSIGLEVFLTVLAFLIFIVGLTVSWWSELIAGTVLLFWFVGLLFMAYWASVHGADGFGAFLGVPGLMLGIGFMASGFNKRFPRHRSLHTAPDKRH